MTCVARVRIHTVIAVVLVVASVLALAFGVDWPWAVFALIATAANTSGFRAARELRMLCPDHRPAPRGGIQ